MEKILNFIHGFVLWTFTLTTFILIDVPLKVIGCILILIVGLLCSIFAPLAKKIKCPVWFDTIYVYVTNKKKLISKYVYKLWR